MHLTCPSCDTTFLVDPNQFGPGGRRVRCGGCGHSWHQAKPADVKPADVKPAGSMQTGPKPADSKPTGTKPAGTKPAAPTPAEAPAAEPEPRAAEAPAAPAAPIVEVRERVSRRAQTRPAIPPRRRGGSALAAGWLVLVLVGAGLAVGAYFGQRQIVAALPAAAELYRLVGLGPAPAGAGLELREVKSVRRVVDGQRVVVIEGLVANVSDQTRTVPPLRASLTDATGVAVDQWTFSAGDETLAPGAVTAFETATRNAPREGSLSINFVAAE